MIIKRGNFIRHSKAARKLFHSFPAISLVFGWWYRLLDFFQPRSWGTEFSFVEPTRQENYFVPLFGSLNDFAR
jgi:hypothetical protein